MEETKTDTQLEIVCKQQSELSLDSSYSHVNLSINQDSDTRSTHQASNTPWLGNAFQSSLSKLVTSFKQICELAKTEKPSYHHKNSNIDDWEIPFERIRITNEFHRCGSQGDVFYGKISNTPVAVKRVKDVSLTKINHLRELNHKNILKFRGISENAHAFFIIMEWCPYGTLHEHIHNGRQIHATILTNFAQQIASGMRYLHSKNIIHRDLKPSNILLTHNDVLKISDFGTHKVFNDKLPVTSASCAGTHAYMAPEVIRSDPYSFPVDIWSYGVVLWEIMIGDEPYKNLDSSAVVWAVGNNSFKLPIPYNFPEGFCLILTGCWKAQPEDRHTFQQICIILKGAVNEVNRIPKERWLPLQAGWKREVRDELNKHLQFKTDPNEDTYCQQKRKALEEALEQAQRRQNKNNDIYLKLQECCLHLQREREDVVRRAENVARRERHQAQLESDYLKSTHELNELKEERKMILEELDRRHIKLACLSQTPMNDDVRITPSSNSPCNQDDSNEEDSIINTTL